MKKLHESLATDVQSINYLLFSKFPAVRDFRIRLEKTNRW